MAASVTSAEGDVAAAAALAQRGGCHGQAGAIVLGVVVGMDAKSAGAVRTAVYQGIRTLAKRTDGQV